MKKTQIQMIKEDLIAGIRITALYALREYGCMRLAARIYDLRADGFVIYERMKRIKTKRGYAYVAEYYI